MAVTALPPQLLKYWSAGEGAAKIRWNSPGDFDRCTRLVQEAVVKGGGAPLAPGVVNGLCATLHKMVTGATPGHASGD